MSTVYRRRHYSVLYKKQNLTDYTILQKNGGTDIKAMGQTKPQFLSDPMSDRKKIVFANSATDIGSVTGITCLTTDISSVTGITCLTTDIGSVTGITCLTTDICSVTGIHFKY